MCAPFNSYYFNCIISSYNKYAHSKPTRYAFFLLDVGSQCIIYAVSAVLLQKTSMTDNDIFLFLTFVILASLVRAIAQHLL